MKRERKGRKEEGRERGKKFQMRKINYAIQKNGNDKKKVELLHIFQERIFERRKRRERATKESDFKGEISFAFSLLRRFSFSEKESEIEREENNEGKKKKFRKRKIVQK